MNGWKVGVYRWLKLNGSTSSIDKRLHNLLMQTT